MHDSTPPPENIAERMQITYPIHSPGLFVFLRIIDGKDVNRTVVAGHAHQCGVVVEINTEKQMAQNDNNLIRRCCRTSLKTFLIL